MMNVTFENSFIVMPADCNYQHGPNGAMMIFGGAFMSQLDLCAASCVNQLLLGTECDSAVTYKVLDGTFHLACESGDIVFMKATVVELRRNAIVVHVTAERQRRTDPKRERAADFRFVFVSKRAGQVHPHGLAFPI